MRQFKLINAIGQTYDLNSLENGILVNPSGIGFAMDSNYVRIHSSWIRTKNEHKQGTIKGTIIFGGLDPYGLFNNFIRWIENAGSVILSYATTAGEFLRDVDIASVSKSELAKGKVLECEITMLAKSLWYTDTERRYTMTYGSDDRTTRYDYRFSSRFRDASSGKVTFVNDGSVPAAIRVTFNGPITNPRLSLMQNGAELYSVTIEGEADLGETIEYSSADADLHCFLRDGSGNITNLVGGMSIMNTNFFKLPVGTSDLVVTADSSLVQPIEFSIRKEFRAV